MEDLAHGLKKDKEHGDAKSYFLGFERGMAWAEGADYYSIREWSEEDHEVFDELVLPDDEGDHFLVISTETKVDWKLYLQGWLEGVREVRRKY